jgi:hypothetical protein
VETQIVDAAVLVEVWTALIEWLIVSLEEELDAVVPYEGGIGIGTDAEDTVRP